jgi:hypothetical protein
MDISTQEAQLIVEALTLIAPTGGSSAAYNLANKISNEYKVDVDVTNLKKHQQTFLTELNECSN